MTLVLDLPLQETTGNPVDATGNQTSHEGYPGFANNLMESYSTYGPGGSLARGMLTCDKGFIDAWQATGEQLNLYAITLPGEFCITAWFRVRQSLAYICTNYGDFTSYIELNAASVFVGCNNSSVTFNPALDSDYTGWTFLCITRDSNNKIRLRVNGGPELVPIVDDALSGDFIVDQIGVGEEGSAYGALAGMRVYDTKPSAEVIQADYERGLPLNHLILDLPCQDDIVGGPSEQKVTDASYANRSLAIDEGNTNNYSIAGPGKNYPKAFLGPDASPSNLVIVLPDEFWIPPTGSFTVSAIAKRPTFGLFNLFQIGGVIDEADYGITPGGDLTFYDIDKTETYSAVLGVDTNWHHYAVVFKSNGDIAFYVDTELRFTATGHRTTETIKITGIGQGTTLGSTQSSVCGFRLYDTELTVQQIKADARLGGIGAVPISAKRNSLLRVQNFKGF